MNHRHRNERAIQHSVAALYAAIGAVVCWTSQYRTAPLRITPGIPDLIVLLPRGKGVLFHEAKAPGGRQRDEQRTFQQACVEANVPYVLGGEAAARTALEGLGLLVTA